MRDTRRYRGFFWPALLILAGIVALLVNTGRISVDRVYDLVNLWPLILVVIGLELIIRRTVHGAAGDVAAALVVLIAIVGAAAYVTVGPSPSATRTLDASSPVGDVTEATLEIDAGASELMVSAGTDVRADLYQAHIEYSGTKPSVDVDTARRSVKISQANNNFSLFQSRRFTANVQLNSGVAWAIKLNSGATTTTINLPELHVTSISINSGAGRDDLTLGPASGVVPVEINGGALTVNVHRPPGTYASISVSGGALSLAADGQSFHAVGKISYQTTPLGSDRYEIHINGGACTVTLDAPGTP